jgi:hypothetical protein
MQVETSENKPVLARKNTDPINNNFSLKPIETKSLSVRQVLNKIDKKEEKKQKEKEYINTDNKKEESKVGPKNNFSIIHETSEYDITSKRSKKTEQTEAGCDTSVNKEIGYALTAKTIDNKNGEYNKLENTINSKTNIEKSINTIFNSDRCGDNILYSSNNMDITLSEVNKASSQKKLGCFARMFKCFKKTK